MGQLIDAPNLPELSGQDLPKQLANCKLAAVLAYTPTCGTCQLAKKIMGVLAEALPQLQCFQINLNHHEDLAVIYGIQSVPCLLIFEQGNLRELIYRFGAAELYEKLAP